MATGQQLTSLAKELAERGHRVTVLTSDRGYDDPSLRFQRRESWQGITIIRIPSVALGKTKKWQRALNFGSFLVLCAFRLLLLPRYDVVVALTSPPLISLIGTLFVKLKGGRFFLWMMDLNPDEAIVAGWLKADSTPTRVLQRLLRFSLKNAERVIVLDRFMKERVRGKGVPEEQIAIVPPWALDDTIQFDEAGRRTFRAQQELTDKFVVMYSGNHSPCHPLDTLLEAAQSLSKSADIVFCFVGGGSEQAKVQAFIALHSLRNIRCLPYQPLEHLSASLSAADLHVIVMGESFPGIVHPCKIYNILSVGTPFLYIGPDESPIADIVAESNRRQAYAASHGDVQTVVQCIGQARSNGSYRTPQSRQQKYSKGQILPKLLELFESEPNGASSENVATMMAKHAKA